MLPKASKANNFHYNKKLKIFADRNKKSMDRIVSINQLMIDQYNEVNQEERLESQ